MDMEQSEVEEQLAKKYLEDRVLISKNYFLYVNTAYLCLYLDKINSLYCSKNNDSRNQLNFGFWYIYTFNNIFFSIYNIY